MCRQQLEKLQEHTCCLAIWVCHITNVSCTAAELLNSSKEGLSCLVASQHSQYGQHLSCDSWQPVRAAAHYILHAALLTVQQSCPYLMQ